MAVLHKKCERRNSYPIITLINKKGSIGMNILTKIYTLLAAAAIAMTLVATPILLDDLADTNIVPSAYAGDTESSTGGG